MEMRDSFTQEELGRFIPGFQTRAKFSEEPLLICEAEGVYYKDTNGNKYMDGLAGVFVVNVGHGNRRVIDAMKDQLDRVAFTPPLQGASPAAIELADLVAKISPGHLDVVQFSCSGSEAVETAIKMARHYHKVRGKAQKVKFISRYNSYHGATLGALSAGGKRGQKASFEPLVPGFIQSQTPHCYRCPYGKEYPGCGITCAVVIDDVIGMEGAETVAGVIVEPMMRRGGAAPPPVEYLPMLREICDRHDVLLIFDEVVTGFGRTGRMFGSFTFDVVPDIMACGKGISSGYAPLSATLTTEEIAFELDKTITNGTHYVHGHTYGGNPVSCAAGIANIQVLLEDKLVENSETMGIHLRKKLNELKSLEVIGAVEGKGLLSGVEFVKDASTKERFPDDLAFGHRVGEECRKRGILLRPDIHDMAFSPPLIVTEDEIDRMVEVVRESIQAVLQSLH